MEIIKILDNYKISCSNSSEWIGIQLPILVYEIEIKDGDEKIKWKRILEKNTNNLTWRFEIGKGQYIDMFLYNQVENLFQTTQRIKKLKNILN